MKEILRFPIIWGQTTGGATTIAGPETVSMFQRLLHVLYAIEFLIALMAVCTVWSEVRGPEHFDYIAWYWKGAIGLPAAWAAVRLTKAMASDQPARRRRTITWILGLVMLAVCAGVVSYYSYLNEPQDEYDDDPGSPTPTALRSTGRTIHDVAGGAVFQAAVASGSSAQHLGSRCVTPREPVLFLSRLP